MNEIQTINSGDKIMLPYNPEYSQDIFIVTRKRQHVDSWILDAFCDGAEDIHISVNIEDAVKI